MLSAGNMKEKLTSWPFSLDKTCRYGIINICSILVE
jgi:hypothetical protein